MNRIYKGLILIALSFSALLSFGQKVESASEELLYPFRSSVVRSPQALGSFYGQMEIGSNFILPSFLTNSNWSNSMIDDQLSQLKSNTATFGYVFEGGFEYLLPQNTKGSRYWFALGHQTNLGVRTTPDAVKLFLNGNSKFKGETLTLGETALEYSRYNFGKVGILKTYQNSAFSAGLGLFIGSNKGGINAQNLDLHTEELGRYVSLSGKVDRHDALQNGFGLGLDFGYSREVANTRVHLRAENIGLVLYRSVRLQETKGEDLNFGGVRINSLRDELVFNEIEDSLENQFLNEDTSRVLYVLPFTIIAQGYHGLKNKHALGWEFRYRYLSGYMPSISGYYQINLAKGNAIRFGAEAGGFGYLGSHVGADIRWGSNILFQIQATGGENLTYASARARFGGRLGIVFRPG